MLTVAQASSGPPQHSGSATELKSGGLAASQKRSLLGRFVRVAAELDEEVLVLAVQLEAHVLNGILVNKFERT